MDLFEQDELEAAVDQLHAATAWYTAEPVVAQLLDMLDWPRQDRRLVDTSAGDGAFLGAALTRLLEAEPQVDDERIAHLITGYEIHYFAAAEARARLERILVASGRESGRARAIAAAIVVHADFVKAGPREPSFHYVTGNPPFCRYTSLPTILREAYEAEMPAYAQADMLHSFLELSRVCLHDGGEIALVTSDRWLFSQAAARLREVIGQRLGIAHMERLDCSSSFYRPKTRKAGQPPRIHPVALVLRDAALCGTALGRAPIFPEADDAPYEGCRMLSEVARVRLAPWLGPHGIFVVTADVAARLPTEVLVPAIDTDDIKGGVLRTPTRYAIRTSPGVEPCAEVMAHLDSQLHRMPKSKRRETKRWLPPESFERMDLSQPSLLIPRISASLRPVRVPAGVLPLDHGISIVSAGVKTLDQIEAALLSPEAQAWVQARAPRLENNFRSLTTTLLRMLPVRL